MSSRPAPKLSLVLPLYDESAVFPELLARLDAFARGFAGVEVVFVDDGSRDDTPALIEKACRERAWCRGVVLSRNFGHQIAVSAGLQHARGDAVAVMDGDLQDPPEVLADFHKKLGEGYDVVYAVRKDRKEGLLMRAAYSLFYRLLRLLSNIPIPLDSGDFCLMSRRVVEQVNAMPERHRFVRGLRSWVGYRQVGQDYPRAARAAGRSKYGFFKLLRLAFDGIITFSEAPLQWSMQFGFLVAAASFAWGAYIAFWRVFGANSRELPGWATMTVGMFFLGGVQLICIGILGEYIGRIHNEVKGRPMFVVDRLLGSD